jgi:hypothetical protein
MFHRVSLILLFTVSLSLPGCGGDATKRPPMAKVKGTVTYKGAPVADATVTFNMEGTPRSAGGVTNADGKFSLTTYDTNDGAFLGTHKVTVTKVTKVSGGKKSEEMSPMDLTKAAEGGYKEFKDAAKGAIPKKYSDLSETPLQFTIEAGENEKNIELED